MGNDTSATHDLPCWLDQYAHGTSRYKPTSQQNLATLASSGVFDWAWRTDWLSLAAHPPNAEVQLSVDLSTGLHCRHVEIVCMPALG